MKHIVIRLSERNKLFLVKMNLILYSLLFHSCLSKWFQFHHQNVQIPFNHFKNYPFNSKSMEIGFFVECKPICGVYLLSDYQLSMINSSFDFIFGLEKTQSIKANETDQNLIRNGLNLLVLNNETSLVQAEIYQDINFDDVNWLGIYILIGILSFVGVFCIFMGFLITCICIKCICSHLLHKKSLIEIQTGVDATELI